MLRTCLTAATAVVCLAVAGRAEVVRTVTSAQSFSPGTRIPISTRGYLFYLNFSSTAAVYAPSGQPAGSLTVRNRNGLSPRLEDAAVSAGGEFAVAAVYPASSGVIVLYDRDGHETRSIDTGPYLPSHLCFGRDGSIWAIGTQVAPSGLEESDYAVVRHYSASGRETGAFVRRSSFPGHGLPPATVAGHSWGIRASGDRIGAWLCAGASSVNMVWLELDSSGAELGRWTLPRLHEQGSAFAGGELYQIAVQRDSAWALNRLDRAANAWKRIESAENPWLDPDNDFGLLMDADGDQLVVADNSGPRLRLKWVKP
ncbi:MAG: hypothetical protein JSU00_09815 [Acidobacteria bacterium]|nr:hypothetical protein [Acidobacteriota bacterium]